jgi:hypothetical protein
MKNLCVKLGGLGALLMSIPVMWRIHEGDKFNPLSFILWSLLSLVCVVVLVRAKKGGHTMMIGYTVSDFMIGYYAYAKQGRVVFGNFEWFIVGLTIVCSCLYVWCELKKNFAPAVIMNAVACALAGIPQIDDIFKDPYQISFIICVLYASIAAISCYGEKPTLNGRLLSGFSVFYWVLIIVRISVARY